MTPLTTKAAEIRAGLVMTSVEKVVGEWRAAMEGVTPGEWAPGCIVRAESGCQCRYIFGGDYMGAIAEVYVDNGIRGLENGQNDCPPVDEARANAAWIAHCSPAGIASLLALIESLIKENAALSNGVSEIADQQQLIEQQAAGPSYHSRLDALCKQQAAELAEARADLDQIADMHIPDCPAHFTGDEAEWAQRHVATLRRIARGSGKPMEQGE